MFVYRVFSAASRSLGRSSFLLTLPQAQRLQNSPTLFNQFHTVVSESHGKFVPSQGMLHSAFNFYPFQRFGVSSSASPEPTEKNGDAKESASVEPEASEKAKQSDSESDEDLSMEDLVKLVAEKEELLKLKHKEIEKMQDKVLRTYAEMENVMDRTRREAENSKKFAVQSFAKGLLDVADNLGRASSIVKESFSKIDTSKDSAGAVPLLKTLLEGVEMTDKQLAEVFKKFGVEKYDPTDEPFDPHRHNAAFQVPNASKPPGTVFAVLKSGYMLHDRVLRPAEVGVTQAAEADAGDNNSAKDNATNDAPQS